MGLGAVWMYVRQNAAFTTSLGPLKATQVAAAIAASGVAAVLTGFFPLMLIGGFLVGFGYAAMTQRMQILADHTPRDYRSTLFSIRQAGVPLGGAVAGIVGSALVLAFGWRPALGALGVLALLLIPSLAAATAALNGPAKIALTVPPVAPRSDLEYPHALCQHVGFAR